MSVAETMQSKETQDLLKRVADIEAQRGTKTVTFMPLFGMYAPTDTGISTEEQLNDFLSKEKDIVADYQRSIIDEYSFNFDGKDEWYNEQESRYRARLTDYLTQHKGEYKYDNTFCYLAEMKARYIDVDSFNINKSADLFDATQIVEEKAGIKDFISLAKDNYIILDTETTGFNFKEDDVIELGMTDINGNVLYDGMFKPDKENSPEAESANHISNAELQDKPTILDEWEKIKTAVAGRKIATYNLDFDKNIMINAAVRHGVPREEIEQLFDNSVCIMQSYTAYKDGYRATKLQNALKENGVEVTQDHRAASDCKVTAQLIQAVRGQIRENATVKIGDKSIDLSSIDSLSLHGEEISNREHDHEDVTPTEFEMHLVGDKFIETTKHRYNDYSYPTENTFRIRDADDRKDLANTIWEFTENNENIHLEISSDGKKETIYPTFSHLNEVRKDGKYFKVDLPHNLTVCLDPESEHTKAPRTWIELTDQNEPNDNTEKDLESARGIGLELMAYSNYVPKDVRDWCNSVLDKTEELKSSVIGNADKKLKFKVGDKDISATIFTLDPDKTPQSLEDVEYYLINDDVIGGGHDLYDIAEDVINYEAEERFWEDEKVKLQDFYEQHIFPLRGIDTENWTNEQRENYGYYSDRHKELYGVRPHGDSRDMCYQKHMENEKMKNDTVKINDSTYELYQLQDGERLHGIRYSTYEKNKGRITFDDFDRVYSGDWNSIQGKTDEEKLDGLFYMFNLRRPSDFRGRSMSVSDVVLINDKGNEKAYYVNDRGFVEMPEFILQKGWEKLTVAEKYEKISDNADIITAMNIAGDREKLTVEQAVEKYAPYIIFKRGERPEEEPDIEPELAEQKEKISVAIESSLKFREMYANNPPKVVVEWSEHPDIKDGQTYGLYEFSSMMERLEEKWINERAKGNPDYEGYAKTKFMVKNIPFSESEIGDMICRQDIGDGDGSLANHIRLVAETEKQMAQEWHTPTDRQTEEFAQRRIDYTAPYIEWAVKYEERQHEEHIQNILYEMQENELVEEVSNSNSNSKNETEEEKQALFDNGIKICSFDNEHNDGDQIWYDRTEFSFNADDNSILISEYEGYYGKTTISRCSADDVLSRFEYADREAEKRKEKWANYQETNEYSFYISARSGYVINQRLDDTVREYLKNNDLTGLKKHLTEDKEQTNALDETEKTQPSEEKPQEIKSANQRIGNTSYRFIPNKTYINTTATAALQIAKLLENNDVKFSGLIKGDKGTITVSKDDYGKVMSLVEQYQINLDKVKGEIQDVGNGRIILDNDPEKVKGFIRDQIAKIMDTDKFKDFCKTENLYLFKRYSFHNALLIMSQLEKSSFVCSANEWKKFGRMINSGEKALKIYCPIILNDKESGKLWGQIKRDIKNSFDKEKGFGTARIGSTDMTITGFNGIYDIKIGNKVLASHLTEDLVKRWIENEVVGKTVIGFKMGNVFDISQTNTNSDILWLKSGFDKKDLILSDKGEPIKNRFGAYKVRNTDERKNSLVIQMPQKIDPQDKEKMEKLYEVLKSVSEKNGYPISESNPTEDKVLKNADGYFSPAENRIVLRDDLELTQKVSTAFHEMAHSIMHNKEAQKLDKDDKDEREVQAEAVACIVGNQFGINTRTASFSYISQFVKSRDLDYLDRSLDKIWKGAKVLSGAIDNELQERSLDLALNKVEKEIPKDKSEVMAKGYADTARQMKEAIMSSKTLVIDSYKMSVVDSVKSLYQNQLQNLEKMQSECDYIISSTTSKEPLTKDSVDIIKAKFDKISVYNAKNIGITAEIESIPQPQTPQQEFITSPINFMNKVSEFSKVSDEVKSIIAQSNYLKNNCSKLLNSSTSEFARVAIKQAENIKNAMSKNGTAVEISKAEYYGTKVPLKCGMVMHPKLADKAVKQTEAEIRLAKKKAERSNKYFPSAKTDVTIYSKLDNVKVKGLVALHTSLNIGDGTQTSLADHISQVCEGKGLVRVDISDNFQDAQLEKDEKTKVVYEPEVVCEDKKSVEHDVRSLKEWDNVLENLRSLNTQEQEQEQEQDSKASILKDDMVIERG